MKTLQQIIDYMEATTEESWGVDVVRNSKTGQNCFFGHLFNMESDEKEANRLWDWFENIATTYMVYPVNDGQNSLYQQPTPKQRVIAYLKDLRDGKAKNTYQIMDEYHKSERLKESHISNA